MRNRFFTIVATVGLLAGAAACSSSPSPKTATTTSGASTSSTVHSHRDGTAVVGYAGSLQVLNEKTAGPAFTSATGYSYSGQGAGAAAVAKYIAAGEWSSTVFESIGGANIETLTPKFTHYWVEFAASPLVVAYNPTGPFGATLKAIADGKKPIGDLFSTMAESGFKLGRTDPNVDPQGQGFLLMMKLAESQLNVPTSTVNADLANSQIFAETSLESTLQAGQLDASSAYLPQAVQMHLPYIVLPDSINLGNPADASTYKTASITLTTPAGKVVSGKPLTIDITTIAQPGESAADSAASSAFVAYTLSPAGLTTYKNAGYTMLSPTFYGSRSGVATSITSEAKAFKAAPKPSTTG